MTIHTRRNPTWQRPVRDDAAVNEVRHGTLPLEAQPAMTRRAVLQPATFDLRAMTVEATISSFAPVQRRDNRGVYTEVLDPAGLDTSRLIGAPLLDGHRQGSARDTIGVVTAFRVEGSELVAVIRLSTADDAAPIVTRIREGTLRNTSIGYRSQRWVESTDPKTGERTRTAVAWVIFEVSAVPVGADPNAIFRSENIMENEEIETVENPMPEEQQQRIRALAEAVGLTRGWAEDRIDEGMSLDDARKAARDAMQTRSRNAPRIRVVGSHDDPAVITRRQTDALAFRMAGGDLPDDARAFAGMSFRDMAVSSLERAGVSTRGLSADDIFVRAAQATTSDFPLVVSNAMGKVALESFKAAESPLKTLCRQRTLPNFKESTAIRLGEMGRLEEMTESGEFTHTTRAENGEVMRLKTFGRAMNVSRKLLIDDDQNMLGDMTAAFGEAAAQTEADVLTALLLDNPALKDGTAVFHATRGNIGTAAAITVDALTEARQAMRLRTGLDGKTLISAAPKFLVVGADRETEAETVLASIQPNSMDAVNPFAGKLTLLVEPRIDDGSWFIFADPARLATMAYAYLSAAPGVQIQRAEAWSVLGMKYRAFLDFGAGWTDWRGAHLNAGA